MRFFPRMLLILLAIGQIVSLALAFQRPAYAYADPGSGLLFVQVAGSMVAGALFIIRSKLRKFFRLGKGPGGESGGESDPEVL